MLKIDLAHAIIEMVELALERGDREHALVVPIRLLAKGHDSRFIDFFFYRGSNYTTVGIVVKSGFPNRHFFSGGKGEWKLEAHHDSCWRSDGIESTLSEFYFNMCKDIAPSTPPKSVGIEVRFHLSPRKVCVKEVTRTNETVHVLYADNTY